MNDEDIVNIDEVFEEIEIGDIIEEMSGIIEWIKRYLITMTVSVIVVKTLQKLVSKL